MITILGQHISLIRPQRISLPARPKNVWPEPSFKPITRTLGIAEFFRMCLTYDTSKVERKSKYYER